jgi:hypothetical protein
MEAGTRSRKGVPELPEGTPGGTIPRVRTPSAASDQVPALLPIASSGLSDAYSSVR